MRKRPILLALLAAAVFGAVTPASKALLSDLSSFQLAELLYLGAAVGGSPVCTPWRSNPPTGERRSA